MTKKNTIKNGKALAAILSASIAGFFLGLFAFLSEVSKVIKNLLTFYPPSGPLSGTSILAVIIWLVSWVILHFTWRNQDANFKIVFIIGVVFIGLGLLLTFPPFIKMFQ